MWLQPYPDVLLEGRDDAKGSIALAFVMGLQRLPPRQRAVLILRDVEGFSTAEVAQMLNTTKAAVRGALTRARRRLAQDARPARDEAPLPHSARERAVAGRFAEAFEGADIGALVALLTEEAHLEMPAQALEYRGREAIARFLATVPAGGRLERFRLVPTHANGQPAFGCYLRDGQSATARAAGIIVLTLAGEHVAAITVFRDTSVFPWFGLPRSLTG
jgi:RNA polymerase sigma-70 factor (ECF subfamily)